MYEHLTSKEMELVFIALRAYISKLERDIQKADSIVERLHAKVAIAETELVILKLEL